MNDRDIFMNAPDDPSPEELERYLDEKCVGDPALRERAAAMFAALAAAQGFLNEMPTVPNLRVGDLLASASPQPTDTEIEGAVIGRYRLQEKIGEGGFGIVYAAQQLEGVERRGALKIIKLRAPDRGTRAGWAASGPLRGGAPGAGQHEPSQHR